MADFAGILLKYRAGPDPSYAPGLNVVQPLKIIDGEVQRIPTTDSVQLLSMGLGATPTTDGVIVTPTAIDRRGILIKGIASQTAAMFEIQDSTGTQQFEVAADGSVTIVGDIGFFNTTPASQQTSGANLTNNVTSGGTNDQIDNWTDLSTYSNDAAAIRNAVYQLSRKLKQVNDGLRTLGLLT